MYDVEDINDIIGMPDGKSTVRATKKGRKQFVIEQLDGTTTIKEFYPVKYTPGISDRLLSINAELSNGAVLSSDNRNNLVLTYGDGSRIVCDRREKTKDGWVSGVDM